MYYVIHAKHGRLALKADKLLLSIAETQEE